MRVKMSIEAAICLATSAHSGQIDKCGEPYILHPLHVMSKVDSYDEKIVAILHDVLEDTNTTKKELIINGISSVQLNALLLLTRKKNQSYKDYIKAISNNDIAVKVKIQDLTHNLDKKRKPLNEDSDKMYKRRKKYLAAYNYLVSGSEEYLNNI